MIKLDHIAISGKTLDEASDYIESTLGVKVQEGGCHDCYGTHNRLLRLGGRIYLEAIAINPKATKVTHPRWFDLDNFNRKPQITNWVCSSKNINREAKRLGFKTSEIIKIERDQLEWLMTVPRDGKLPFDGACPSILQWRTTTPIKELNPSGCELKHLTIFHPDAATLREKMKALTDSRISFELNHQVSFFAEFDTPHGIRSTN